MAAGSSNPSPVPNHERIRRGCMKVILSDVSNVNDEKSPMRWEEGQCKGKEEVSDVSGFLVAATLEKSSHSIIF